MRFAPPPSLTSLVFTILERARPSLRSAVSSELTKLFSSSSIVWGRVSLGVRLGSGDLGLKASRHVAEFLHLCVRTAYNQFWNLRDGSIPTLVFMESSCDGSALSAAHRGGDVNILLSGNGAHPTGGKLWNGSCHEDPHVRTLWILGRLVNSYREVSQD